MPGEVKLAAETFIVALLKLTLTPLSVWVSQENVGVTDFPFCPKNPAKCCLMSKLPLVPGERMTYGCAMNSR